MARLTHSSYRRPLPRHPARQRRPAHVLLRGRLRGLSRRARRAAVAAAAAA